MREVINLSGSSSTGVPLSPAVRAGDFIFVSGQVARNGDGSVYLGDIDREITGAINAVEEVLQAGGAGLSSVVKISAFLANSLLFPRFNELYRERFPDNSPARTTVVTAFGDSDVRVEIEAVAYVGD